MYVTAHRVSRRESGETGINAFFFLHGDHDPEVRDDWNDTDMDQVSYRAPGTLTRQSIELSLGGNTVMSYLDIVARDGTSEEQIRQTLREFQGRIAADKIPMTLVIDHVAIRFGLVQGLSGQEPREFEHLSRAIQAVLYT